MKKHVLIETDYCATMFEGSKINGRRCTAAGRYMDTEGRVNCLRCAAGRVVVKLSDIPKLLQVVEQLDGASGDLIAQLRMLVARAPEVS